MKNSSDKTSADALLRSNMKQKKLDKSSGQLFQDDLDALYDTLGIRERNSPDEPKEDDETPEPEENKET